MKPMTMLNDFKIAMNKPGKLILLVSVAIISIVLLSANYLKLANILDAVSADTTELSSLLKEADAVGLTASIQDYENNMTSHRAAASRLKFTYLAVLVISFVMIVAIAFISLSRFGHSVSTISNTLDAARSGDLDARSSLGEKDALVNISQALDDFLDQRVAVEKQSRLENKELSNAVVNLLHGVHRLSKKDLTARVEVTEDATGPIADSLNLLADEIAKVLQGVVDISDKISHTCHSVKDQSDTVVNLSGDERMQIDSANAELLAASKAMVEIATLAQTCNAAADEAIQTTATAKDTVEGTVEEITKIRETIRETEKRIKRLGERSQEISSVVSLINSIAERTHILALNASCR